VQEFQLILSNYNAEYGRATGGVINIVTKSGANEIHGDIFGYFRNKSFQSRNPFSGKVNPLPAFLILSNKLTHARSLASRLAAHSRKTRPSTSFLTNTRSAKRVASRASASATTA